MTLLDARGCLTEQGLAALARAPAGQAPPEVAAHLASCPRCQDRLLGAERAAGERGAPARRPFRNLIVVGAVLLGTLLLLGVTLAMLGAR
ncbi:MAG TPA: hypothetical protein VFX28_21365 [Methylomirabilota bacterium]|nr:hypothetical protein [Methylomirabilota bacterium]